MTKPGASARKVDIAAWPFAAGLSRLLDVLDRDGEETRVVGGAVRNALIDSPIHEIDVATTAIPEEVVRRVKAAGFKAVPTGIEHGTVTVVDGPSYAPYFIQVLNDGSAVGHPRDPADGIQLLVPERARMPSIQRPRPVAASVFVLFLYL